MNFGTMICVGLLGVLIIALLIFLFVFLGMSVSELRYIDKQQREIQEEIEAMWRKR